jgi:GTP-binding protein EngB required for normal cell division
MASSREARERRNFIVWGQAGVGKTTMINDILGLSGAAAGQTGGGAHAGGVTKELTGYPGEMNGIPVMLWDMPGHGDLTVPPWQVLSALVLTFKGKNLDVDGVLMLTNEKNRVTLGPRQVVKLLEMSFTAPDKWSAMVLVGTMADTWTAEEKSNFKGPVLTTFNKAVGGNITKVVTTSIHDRSEVTSAIVQLIGGAGIGSMTLLDIRQVATSLTSGMGVKVGPTAAQQAQLDVVTKELAAIRRSINTYRPPSPPRRGVECMLL